MKAVCHRDQIAYDVKTGCPDCLARERDAYLARGVPDDDAPLFVADAPHPWLDASHDILADLAELAERLKPAPCKHEYDFMTLRCRKCSEPASLPKSYAIGFDLATLGLDANGSPVDEEPEARFAPDTPIILGCKTQWKLVKTTPPPALAGLFREGDSYYERVADLAADAALLGLD